MAWSESDRVMVRAYLGFASVHVQGDLRLENALTLVQSTADGGQRPDNSAELQIRVYMSEVVALEAAIKAQRSKLIAADVGTLKVDAMRAQAGLRREGREQIGRISGMLNVGPRDGYDYFSGRAPSSASGPQTYYGA